MLEKVREETLKLRKNLDTVYEAGQKAEYNAFWDDFQNLGNRTDYQYAFCRWTEDIFKPKYDINTTTNTTAAFRYATIPGSLKKILDDCGVKFVWGSSGNTNSMFYGSKFTELPHIEGLNSLGFCFCSCSNLETIESLGVSKLAASSSVFTDTFSGCKALKNLTIIGTLKFGINVSACPLTHASLISIIDALEAKTSGTFKVTLGATNIAKLSPEEQDSVSAKGWDLE